VVFLFRHVTPTLAPVAGTVLGTGDVTGLAGKARDRANVGLTWGVERGDTPSKRRTVRNDEGVSITTKGE